MDWHDFFWGPRPNTPEESSSSLLNVGNRTRFAALWAFVFSLIALAAVIWLWFAVADNSFEFKVAYAGQMPNEKWDSVAAAAAVGRLDVLSLLVAVVAVIAGVALLYSGTTYRAAAIAAAKEETERVVPLALRSYLAGDGAGLVKAALKDAELLAFIQQGFKSIGIDDTEDVGAELIETNVMEGGADEK